MSKTETATLIDRRLFVGGSLAAALLLATPGFAAAIHTDAEGLTAGDVKIPIQGGEIAAYRAFPAKGGPFPTVLVAHDEFGVSEHMQDVVRRLAKLGYFAICPNLYSRQADVSKMTSMMDVMAQVVSKVVDAQILSDLDATVEFAKKSGKADVGRLGITGFSWGGRVVWLYAAHNPKLKAGVSWYGFLGASRDPQGHSAISLAPGIKSPVLGLYAGKDDFIMEYDLESMKLALNKASKSEIVLFPGKPHGFFADTQPTYDATTAADGWNRLTLWFKAHGVG
jgi:carboxymethylenebutenolidase